VVLTVEPAVALTVMVETKGRDNWRLERAIAIAEQNPERASAIHGAIDYQVRFAVAVEVARYRRPKKDKAPQRDLHRAGKRSIPMPEKLKQNVGVRARGQDARYAIAVHVRHHGTPYCTPGERAYRWLERAVAISQKDVQGGVISRKQQVEFAVTVEVGGCDGLAASTQVCSSSKCAVPVAEQHGSIGAGQVEFPVLVEVGGDLPPHEAR
jgi:hypothetical protein